MDIYNDVAQGIKPRASFTGTQQGQEKPNQASFTRTSAGSTNNFGYLVTQGQARTPTGSVTSMPAAKPEAPPSMDAVNGLISDVSSRAPGLSDQTGEQIDAAMEGAQAGGQARMNRNLSGPQFGGIQPPEGPAGQDGGIQRGCRTGGESKEAEPASRGRELARPNGTRHRHRGGCPSDPPPLRNGLITSD